MRRTNHAGGRLYRRTKHGKVLRTWTMELQTPTGEVRESTGETDKKRAQVIFQRRLGEIAAGTYTGPDRSTATVDDLLTHLLDTYATKRLRSLPSATAQVKALRAALGPTRAQGVTTALLSSIVKRWQQARHPVSDATINRRLSLLRRAFALSKLRPDPLVLDFHDLLLVENSPLGKHIDAPAFATLHGFLPACLQVFFAFCYQTGKRKGQMSRTTWAHWNPHTREFTWTAAEVKAKRPEVLPLDGTALAIIEQLSATRTLHCPYVFHGSRCTLGHRPSKAYGCVGDFKKAWASACRRAGFPVGRKAGGYVFHNTRHTAVTNLVNSGTPAHEAMTVSGHRTRSVFDRYSIPLKDQTRAALRRVGAYTAQQDTTPTVVPLPKR